MIWQVLLQMTLWVVTGGCIEKYIDLTKDGAALWALMIPATCTITFIIATLIIAIL